MPEEKKRRKVSPMLFILLGMLLSLGIWLALNRLSVHPFRDVMGMNGYCCDANAGTIGYKVRTYYEGNPFLRNGIPIAVNYGFPNELSEYAADLDGDGCTELICTTGVTSRSVGTVLVYRRDADHGRKDVVTVGTLPLVELGLLQEDADAGLVRQCYLPETGEIGLNYTTLGNCGEYPETIPAEGFRYAVWASVR